MGSGGSRSLWPPGKPVATGAGHVQPPPLIRTICFNVGSHSSQLIALQHDLTFGRLLGCYMVKPHGQLVLVSLTHYCASTPSLSTSWSRTTLQGAQGPGKTHLETSFPLRCFQRLSLPHLATRRCHWRDNRYTRDASTPVLSY